MYTGKEVGKATMRAGEREMGDDVAVDGSGGGGRERERGEAAVAHLHTYPAEFGVIERDLYWDQTALAERSPKCIVG